jgi:hypothetical protein
MLEPNSTQSERRKSGNEWNAGLPRSRWAPHRIAVVTLAVKIRNEEDKTLLWTIFVILLVLWLLGMVSSYTLGGYIHILLILAIVVVLIRVIQGRRPIA